MTQVTPRVHVLAGLLMAVLTSYSCWSPCLCPCASHPFCIVATSMHVSNQPACVQVAVLTNGSADGVAKPALTVGGAVQLLKGPLLDINMAQVC